MKEMALGLTPGPDENIKIFNLYLVTLPCFLIVLGLPCCTLAFSFCREWELLFVVVLWFLIAVASLVAEHGLWGSWASAVGAQGLVALWHVGSSQSRVQTCVPCIGRWILHHWTKQRSPIVSLLNFLLFQCFKKPNS